MPSPDNIVSVSVKEANSIVNKAEHVAFVTHLLSQIDTLEAEAVKLWSSREILFVSVSVFIVGAVIGSLL